MDECECNTSTPVFEGDGCRYCEPQVYINSLNDLVSELLEEQESLEQEIRDRPV
jgi:hypothetical protein